MKRPIGFEALYKGSYLDDPVVLMLDFEAGGLEIDNHPVHTG